MLCNLLGVYRPYKPSIRSLVDLVEPVGLGNLVDQTGLEDLASELGIGGLAGTSFRVTRTVRASRA